VAPGDDDVAAEEDPAAEEELSANEADDDAAADQTEQGDQEMDGEAAAAAAAEGEGDGSADPDGASGPLHVCMVSGLVLETMYGDEGGCYLHVFIVSWLAQVHLLDWWCGRAFGLNECTC
jgi:hypothetical protein